MDAAKADTKLILALGVAFRGSTCHDDGKLSIKGCDIRPEVDLLSFHHLIGNERSGVRIGHHVEAVN
jgi:hypothetical protein